MAHRYNLNTTKSYFCRIEFCIVNFSYVDRLADSLHQKLKTANNLLRQARAIIERRESAKQLQIATEPKLENVVEKTKELKKDVNMNAKYDYITIIPQPLLLFQDF